MPAGEKGDGHGRTDWKCTLLAWLHCCWAIDPSGRRCLFHVAKSERGTVGDRLCFCVRRYRLADRQSVPVRSCGALNVAESQAERLIDFFMMTLMPLLFIPPGIILWQGYHWLETAQWRPVAVSDALAYFEIPSPHFRLLGLQKIAETVLDFPLSGSIFFLWLALFVGSILCGDGVRRKQWDSL
jgi:hypothetical protein